MEVSRIPKSHPRYFSLIQRERIVEMFKAGIVVPQGLIAHGRGEAFDYILAERTWPPAERAEKAAVALMKLAKNPIISLNGNAAALAPFEVAELSKVLNAKVEVNLFYYSEERAKRIKALMESYGTKVIVKRDAEIPNLLSERGKVNKKGIYSADVVLVMLEDGDRTEKLRAMGKKVIAIDLNPFSRTATMADITIVDNVVRALPNMIRFAREMSLNEAKRVISEFDNKENLREMVNIIMKRLRTWTPGRDNEVFTT